MRNTLFILSLFLFVPVTLSAQNFDGKSTSIDSSTNRVMQTDPSGLSDPYRSVLRKAKSLYVGLEGIRERRGTDPIIYIGSFPEVLTSFMPAPEPERVEGAEDLDWLQDLQVPDLPIRWDDRVIKLLQYYRNTKRGNFLVQGWFRQANQYRSMILRKLREASLPDDLLYVAMVESGFDPTARSAAGALGMWQFIATSADEYGLKRSRWFDQRMSPEHSTDAALQYLKDLYRQFGSWELSLAAFNMGYGALLRTIRKYNSNDFWLLSRLEAGLPFETIHYVTKIMACAIIGRNPERFGLEHLDGSLDDRKVSFVEVSGGIALGRLARAVGVSKDELSELNPDLKRARIPPDVKTWPLRIPADKHAQFLQKWSKIQPSSSSPRHHTIRFGEQLSDIARMYDTTTYTIRQLNRLDDTDAMVPGFQILVPNVIPKQLERTEPVVVAVPNHKFVYTGRRRVFYRVTHQDTIQEIARFFEITEDNIRKWNGVTLNAHLQRGMILQLFIKEEFDLSRVVVLTPDEVRILVVGSEEFFDYHEAQRDRIRIRYRIRPGDTLTRLAKRFELTVGSIARINQFSRNETLQVDQEIIVYVPKKMAEKLQ